MKKSVILILTSIIFMGCFPEQCELYTAENSINQDFSGVIDECYFQDSDGGRGNPTIVLRNKKLYYTETHTLICYAQPGDSIIKKPGTLKYIIKRNDSSVIFYPECGNTVILDSGKTKENPMFSKEIMCNKRK